MYYLYVEYCTSLPKPKSCRFTSRCKKKTDQEKFRKFAYYPQCIFADASVLFLLTLIIIFKLNKFTLAIFFCHNASVSIAVQKTFDECIFDKARRKVNILFKVNNN